MPSEAKLPDPDDVAEATQATTEKLRPGGTMFGWIKEHSGAIVAIIGATATVVASGVGATIWISGQFADVRKDISTGMAEVRKDVADLRAETRADSAKLNERIEGLNTRLTRLENRMDAKFGADTEIPDGGASTDGGDLGPWSAVHVGRRGKYCAAQCKTDLACLDKCTSSYNVCGIKCPSTWPSPCINECIAKLPGGADAGTAKMPSTP